MAVNHWTSAGDALILKNQTHLPHWLWAVLWGAGTLGAVYLGFLLLVPRS
jgi:purine-cytosine permease-like protein